MVEHMLKLKLDIETFSLSNNWLYSELISNNFLFSVIYKILQSTPLHNNHFTINQVRENWLSIIQ